jgi:hypothetical protein
VEWQRRRSEHGAPAIPDDDHAADSPQYRPDDPYADGAGHRYPGLRALPARLQRLNFPSRLRIDVSPGLQRRRRRDGGAAGRRGAGAGASVRPRRDSVAARLQMRARGARWSGDYTGRSQARRTLRGAPRTWWLAERRRGPSPWSGPTVVWCPASRGSFRAESQVCLLLYKRCDELPSNAYNIGHSTVVLRSMSENSFLCSLRLLMLNNIVMIK